VALTAYPVRHPTLTTRGQVLDGVDIEGPVVVKAAGVIIKRSRIHMPSGYKDSPSFTNVLAVTGIAFTMTDTEVTGLGADGRPTAATVCLQMLAPQGHLRRIDVNHCGDGMRGGRYVVEDSYIHDFWMGDIDGVVLDTPHADIWQSLGGPENSDIVIRHNTGFNPVPPPHPAPEGGGVPNSVFQCRSERGTLANVLFEDNLVDGGGFSFNINGDTRGFVVRDNRFGRQENWGLMASHGAAYSWIGNVWDDTGRVAVG
jgi:hypothetical protein